MSKWKWDSDDEKRNWLLKVNAWEQLQDKDIEEWDKRVDNERNKLTNRWA